LVTFPFLLLPPGPLSNPDQSLAEPKLADSSEFIRKIPAAAINPTAQNYPVPSAKPTRPFTAARQIYETQQRYFAQGKDQQPQINVRV